MHINTLNTLRLGVLASMTSAPKCIRNLLITLLASGTTGLVCAQQPLKDFEETFRKDTTGDYTVSSGYTQGYVKRSGTDFGDGNDGAMSISVESGNTYGELRYRIGTIQPGNKGNHLRFRFYVNGISKNYHKCKMVLTLDGVPVESTVVPGDKFVQWNTEGTAPMDPEMTMGSWRTSNGVGTVEYTIKPQDIGKTLGWQSSSTKTSKGGYSFMLDRWEMQVNPKD